MSKMNFEWTFVLKRTLPMYYDLYQFIMIFINSDNLKIVIVNVAEKVVGLILVFFSLRICF